MSQLPLKRNKTIYGLFIYLLVILLGGLPSGSEAANLMPFVPLVIQETTSWPSETRLEENESLDKTDVPRKESFDQTLPRRIQNQTQAHTRIVLPDLNFRPRNPFTSTSLSFAPSNKSYSNLPRWLILQTLLI